MIKLEVKDIYGVSDIARRVCSQCKGLSIPDAKAIIDMAIVEISNIIVNEEAQVRLKNLCVFSIKNYPKLGVDFRNNYEKIHYGDFKRIVIKPTLNLRNRFEKAANAENWARQKRINKEIGYVSMPTEKREQQIANETAKGKS